MDVLSSPQSSSVESVEAVKNLLDAGTEGPLLVHLVAAVLSYHRTILLRRLYGEALYKVIARHCVAKNDIDAAQGLAKGFLSYRELARHARDLKRTLLSAAANPAAIGAVFLFPLLEAELASLCAAAARAGVVPDSWSSHGLAYPAWIVYCARNVESGAVKNSNFIKQVQRAAIAKSLDMPMSVVSAADAVTTGAPQDADMHDSELSAEKVLEQAANPVQPLSEDKWRKILCSSDYAVRCAGAELVAAYIASGAHQDSTLKVLMQLKREMPLETRVRALAAACVSLSHRAQEPPSRSGEEGFSQAVSQKNRLPATQIEHDPINSSSRVDGVLSYLELFQGQNVLYLALVDALKYDDPLSLFAAHHIHQISIALNKSPWQLFQPYWPSLAPKVVRNYNSSWVAWFCSAVLRVSKDDFLLRTASIIVPHLCFTGGSQLQVCAEISGLRGRSLRRLYIDNAAAIIAMLLMCGATDLESAWDYAETRFMALDRGFKSLNFNEIVASWRVDTMYEVLMLTTDHNADLATGIIRRILDCACAVTPAGAHKEMLQQTVFKLVVKFSETMRNLMGRQSLSTKLSALIGLRTLVQRVFDADLTASVLRQLTAFLQAALETPALAQVALEAWLAVIQHLGDAQLEAIVDLTYAIINQCLDRWDAGTIDRAREIAIHIQNRRRDRPDIFTGIHPEPPFDLEEIQPTAGKHTYFEILESLVKRDTNNMYLAHQTARDICACCLEYQTDILMWAHGSTVERDLLGRTVRTLLYLCSRGDDDLTTMSSAALGLLGALDPQRVDIDPHSTPLVIVSNFTDAVESVEFSRVLIQNHFLPAFEASVDPVVQKYFAYGIQELLKFMSATEYKQLVDLFGSSLGSTLLPLLKTKYTTELKHWKPPQYPIYNPHIAYQDWLTLFCSDMMGRSMEPENANRIFKWSRKVLHGANVGPEMWAFLLPYAALTAVLDPREGSDNREVFLSEILLVLGRSGRHMHPFHERVFAVVDYFNRWMRSRRQAKQSLLGMDNLLERIPARLMAERALESGAFPRSVRYYEHHVREEPESINSVLESLRLMYASMQDIDSLEGVSARLPTMSVEQQVLEYRATSQWDAALACYNALPSSNYTLEAALECLQRSGRDREVLAEINNVDSVKLAPLATECSWFLGDWDSLAKWTPLVDGDALPVSNQLPPLATQAMGNALIALRNRDFDSFISALVAGRRHAGQRLGDIMNTLHLASLRKIREISVYLHGLADLENLGSLVLPGPVSNDMRDASTGDMARELLKGRLQVLSPLSEGPEFEARRFLLSLQGTALSCIENDIPWARELIIESHLSISSAARLHNQPNIALMEIATAKEMHTDKASRAANVEHARLMWSQGEARAAIRMIGAEIPDGFSNNPRHYSEAKELALEWTTWRDHAAQADSNKLIENYTTVTKAAPQWAEAYYRLAKHYVKLYDEGSAEVRADGIIARNIVVNFSRALQFGTPHTSESLPKLLTTWLDLGITPRESLTPQQSSTRRLQLGMANRGIAKWASQVPARLLHTAIPQLLSRHNHQNSEVRRTIEKLVVGVAVQYPNHTLWALLEKDDHATSMVHEVAKRSPELARQVQAAIQMVVKLRKVCFYQTKETRLKIQDFRADFSSCLRDQKLAVPVQSNMDSLSNVWILEIDQAVVIQQSLQRPKRIGVWGTDGLKYPLLLKGNDDVRKDARLIEFTGAVNQLLSCDPAATARHLRILTYRVTPLGANTGIIEWVEGALPARGIVYGLGRVPHLAIQNPAVKRMTSTSLQLSERIAAFEHLQQEVPPVLWEWFVGTFPDPEAWLEARTRYARTLAVMSMVGYILGLGDRHLENILLLQNSGAVLHVDFDCLFDKGRNLQVPEIVPFRLTQQFRDALGVVNQYEGPFRKVSELTLKLVRENEDLLMVVLEAFVYDPIVFDKVVSLSPNEAMKRTRAKIRGIREPNGVPLGVGGLVDELINAATSAENLCQMFKGWMPWV